MEAWHQDAATAAADAAPVELLEEASVVADAVCDVVHRRPASEAAAALARAAGHPLAAFVATEPFGLAIEYGRLDVAKVCVAAGAVPRTAFHNSRSALSVAAQRGHEVLAWMLDVGGDARIRDDACMTPLMWAGGPDGAANATALLDAGAELEAVDRHGQTPLMWASMLSEPAVVTTLLDAGANPWRRCSAKVAPPREPWGQAQVPGARADEMVGKCAGLNRWMTYEQRLANEAAIRTMLAAALAAGDHEAKRMADLRRRAWRRRGVAVAVWAVIRVGEWV